MYVTIQRKGGRESGLEGGVVLSSGNIVCSDTKGKVAEM